MPVPDLVIFDCDGVLVDSEMLASTVLSGFLSEFGCNISASDCRRFFTGISIAAVEEKVRTQFGTSLPENFEDQLRQRDTTVFESELVAIEGIRDVLETIDLPVCVASSGSPEKIRNSLRITGLASYFGNHLFSAAQVARGKPAPDLFLLAALEMGADTSRTCVIEDSVPGIRAGLAAGMRVLGFTGGAHARDDIAYKSGLKDAGAHHVFDRMHALPGLLSL